VNGIPFALRSRPRASFCNTTRDTLARWTYFFIAGKGALVLASSHHRSRAGTTANPPAVTSAHPPWSPAESSAPRLRARAPPLAASPRSARSLTAAPPPCRPIDPIEPTENRVVPRSNPWVKAHTGWRREIAELSPRLFPTGSGDIPHREPRNREGTFSAARISKIPKRLGESELSWWNRA